MVLEKSLESPLDCRTARRSIQSILKKINPEYSLEKTLMLERLKAGDKDQRR